MEYGLGLKKVTAMKKLSLGLNPCYNGIWSRTRNQNTYNDYLQNSLNPCYNGIWSRTKKLTDEEKKARRVLILVIMEYGLGPGTTEPRRPPRTCLNPCYNGIWSRTLLNAPSALLVSCLNPCYNGIWSRTRPHLRR